MTDRPRKALFPNPFYVVLLIASTAFVVTAMMYYVSPLVLQRALDRPGGPPPSPGTRALVDWLDHRGPITLGIEFIVMLISGALSMATDQWFTARSRRNLAKTDD